MFNIFKKEWLYFVTYTANNNKSFARGNYRIKRNSKIKTSEDFNDFETYVKDCALSDCNTLKTAQKFTLSEIVIMNVQLLH